MLKHSVKQKIGYRWVNMAYFNDDLVLIASEMGFRQEK